MKKLMILMCLLFGLAGTAFASVQTIYSDALTGSGALNGTAPTVRGAVAGGSASATWISGATKTASGAQYSGGERGFLPFVPQSGYIYTLTATVQLTGASDWVSLGFSNVSNAGQWHTTGNKYAWALVRNSGGGIPQAFAGPGASNGTDFATGAESGLQTLIITLDTTGASWKFTATIAGKSSTMFTYSSNPTSIAFVGFGMDGIGTATVRDFSLTATTLTSMHNIKGTVTSGGSPLAGASIYYSLTSGGPYNTVSTASDGTYSILANDNSGPYYIKAGKTDYFDSAEYSPAPSVGTTDVTGINFSLTPMPKVTWLPAATVSSDLDVSKIGSLVYAVRFYSGTNSNPTINGVTFGSPGTNLTLPGTWQLQNGLGAPSTLSTAYQKLLGSDSYSDGTLTLKGLTVGRTYLFQVWANDSRAGAADQIETVTLGNSVGLNKNISGSGYGQQAMGTFTASSTTQDFTVSGGAFNALQLRLLSGSALHFIRGTVTPGSATVYYSTTSGGPYNTVSTAADGTYSFPVSDSTTYYVKAGKAPQYADSAERTVAVGTSDVTGIDFTLTANTTVTVSGTVSDTNGGVSGALVFYSLSASGLFSGSFVTAGSNGTYSFNAYKNATYYVKAGALGHLTTSAQTVSVGTTNVTGVNISLTKSIIANADFSDNGAEYTTYPGYSSSPNPTLPWFWTISGTGAGVNGASGVTVFGPDNKPSGYWAFMQLAGTYIKQALATTSGKTYLATYSVAARSGNGGTIRAYVSSDGGTTDIAGLTSTASTSAFQQVSFVFSAPASSTLVFKNVSSSGDYTVCVKDISITTTIVVSGTVRSGSTPISGAIVYYSTTSGGPYSQVTTASDGTYFIPTNGNVTYYLKVYKLPQYVHSSEVSVVVGTTDRTGIDFSLASNPAYTITASVVGTGGTITPAGVTSLYQGQTQAYDITPDTGKAVTSLKIDGVAIAPALRYTFTNISANHTITATFGMPPAMNGKSILHDLIAPYRVVRTFGKVKSINGMVSMVINDGSGNVTVMLNGLTPPSNLDSTRTLTVTGWLGIDRKVYAQAIMLTPGVVDGNIELKRMHYGFFVHYVWGGTGAYQLTVDRNGVLPSSLDDLANRFDAEGFANDLASWQIEFVIFTAWHAGINPLFPSQTMLKWGLNNHYCQRDLLGDMIKACKAKGIKVMFYTHPRDGHDLSYADQVKTGWAPTFNYQTWNDFTNDLYGELVDRYGDDIVGLYLDEGGNNGAYVDFPRLRHTIKDKHPNVLMMQNNYGNLYSCDIFDQEFYYWGAFGGSDGSTWPTFTWGVGPVMGSCWWSTVPVGSNVVRYSAEDMFRYTVLEAGANTDGGGVQWAAGPYVGGGWETGVDTTMRQVGAYIKAIAPALKGTVASRAYTTPAGATTGTIAWGVATDEVDGSATYLHVLKAPLGRSLTISKAANGVVFTGATLFISGKTCGFTSNATQYVITLPDDETWDSLDTVIKLQVAGR